MIPAKFHTKLSRDDSWRMDRPHFHEDVEILLCLRDCGDFFIGTELFELRRGALFLISEATIHRSIAKSLYERYILHISPAVLKELSTAQSDFLSFFKDSGRCALLDEKTTRQLCRKFAELEKPCDESFGCDLRQTVSLLDFLIQAFSCFDDCEVEKTSSNSDFARIEPILDFINAHLSEPLTLDMISSSLFINKYHLCHIFKQATGFSVIEYIIHSRVLKARELLRTGMRVQEVGETVGFQNNQHFIRTFGTLTGTSPKKYAKEYLTSDRI